MKKPSRVRRFARFVLRGGRRSAGAAGPLEAKPKLVVFDFDGTLADTFANAFEILNILAPEFGFRPLALSELELARDMRTRDVMKFLGIRATKMPGISRRGTEELHKRMGGIRPFAGILELLGQVRAAGFRLGILTSNSEQNVTTFLRNNGLGEFDFIQSSSKLMGKASVIRRILKANKLKAREVLLIGDETRDIEAAQEVGVHIVAVTWGYNSARSIRELQPDYLVDSVPELASLLGAINQLQTS